MPLVVPALRLFLLFLNVFETFKTLKPPARSRRTGEQTPRAISQRKRDMKGCMTIWLLWCSYSVCEGLADSTVGIVMPFYNEIKAVLYLFQILTRARGAEPIYLHVMRPLVKPYVATLDWALDSGHLFGDFIMLLISIPVGMVKNWWNPSSAPATESETPTPESESTESLHEQTNQPQRARVQRPPQPANGNSVGLRTRSARQQASEGGSSVRNGTVRVTRPNAPQSRSDATSNKHKIWRPPSQAYEAENGDRPVHDRRIASESDASAKAYSVASSTPPVGTPEEADEPSMVAGEGEDYPPFPSAYPITPQVVPKGLKPKPNPKPEALRQNSMNEPRPRAPIQARTVRGRGKGPINVQGPAHQTMPGRMPRRLHGEDDVIDASNVSDFGVSLERLPVSST